MCCLDYSQVNVSVRAFLARHPDSGLQPFGFGQCSAVLDAFSINTSIDRCAEPGPMGLYRCTDHSIKTIFVWPQAPHSHVHASSLYRTVICRWLLPQASFCAMHQRKVQAARTPWQPSMGMSLPCQPLGLQTGMSNIESLTWRQLRRRVVQIEVVSTEVHVEMSQFVKQELHSLFSYLHSTLLDKQLASTFSRHFTKRVGFSPSVLIESCICPCHCMSVKPKSLKHVT